jgi:hypothetical protein
MPCPGLAEVAGTWECVLKFPAQTVDSITLSDHVLTFGIRRIDVAFTGNLMQDGTIVGTLTQRGAGFPLVLTRSAGVARTGYGQQRNR